MTYQTGLPRAEPPEEGDPKKSIIDFWIALNMGGDAGCTTWEVLDRLSNQVTECLMRDPPDLMKAWGLTAKAGLLIEGKCEC